MLIDDDFAPSQTQPLLGRDAAGASLSRRRGARRRRARSPRRRRRRGRRGRAGVVADRDVPRDREGHRRPGRACLPKGFEEAGVGFGCLMIGVSYAVFAFSATRLLECWRIEGGGSYGTLAKKALGKRGMHLVRVSLVLQQCGVLLTYFIFIATNVQQVLSERFGADLDLFVLVLAQLALQVPLG